MGKIKYQNQIKSLFEKSPVVAFSSINRIVREKRKTNYAKLLVANLIKQGKIKKLAKGVYTKHNNIELAVFCFKPAYIGLQSALSMHNLWEQETIPIIVTSKNSRSGMRKIMGQNVLIRKINKKYLFGYEYLQDGDFYIPYSDIEKTFIDLIIFRQKISKETIKIIKSKINLKKLKSYLKVYPKKLKNIVLNNLTA